MVVGFQLRAKFRGCVYCLSARLVKAQAINSQLPTYCVLIEVGLDEVTILCTRLFRVVEGLLRFAG